MGLLRLRAVFSLVEAECSWREVWSQKPGNNTRGCRDLGKELGGLYRERVGGKKLLQSHLLFGF